MAERAARRTTRGAALEKSVADTLAAARPLPPGDEMIINNLTEDEEKAFENAIRKL